MLLGIYIPAIILELLIIKNKDNIKTIYQYFIKSERSFTIFFIIVILMDFIASISMLLNGWANVVLTNVLIIMFVAFIIGISIYRNSIGKKYEEIDRLNKLLIDKNNELKKIKHDYGSQISYINGLYIMQQYDRLGEMLKKIISGNAEVSSSVEYITNRDSIICSVVESLDLKDIHVVVDEEFDSNLIDISEYELHKIVSNILSNAATALDGNGLIVIKTYKIFNNIYLSIKNNGPQIDPSIIDKIFNTGFTTKSNKDESHGYGLHIVKEIVENNKLNIPIFVAGGISQRSDVKHFFDLGVDGIQVATRFITTYECDASIKYKEAFLKAIKEDIGFVSSPVGMPGRAMQNSFVKKIKKEKIPVKKCYQCLIPCDVKNTPYCISRALIEAVKGNLPIFSS